jgi:hypothetical protein
MPTVQGTDDFNHAISLDFYDAIFGAPTSESSPIYPNGGVKTLSVPSTGGNVGVRKNITGGQTLPWAAFPVRVPSAPATTSVNFLTVSPNAGQSARIEIKTDGQVEGFFTGGGSAQLGPFLTAGTWYWVEAIIDFSGTTYTGYWRVDDVAQTPFTFAGQPGSTAAYNQLLSHSGNGTLTWLAGLWKWGFAANTADWLGSPDTGEDTLRVVRSGLRW